MYQKTTHQDKKNLPGRIGPQNSPKVTFGKEIYYVLMYCVGTRSRYQKVPFSKEEGVCGSTVAPNRVVSLAGFRNGTFVSRGILLLFGPPAHTRAHNQCMMLFGDWGRFFFFVSGRICSSSSSSSCSIHICGLILCFVAGTAAEEEEYKGKRDASCR